MSTFLESGSYGNVYTGSINGVEYIKKVAHTDPYDIVKGPTEEYIREADILRRCSHPNIVRIVDAKPEDSSLLLEKGLMNLKDFIREYGSTTDMLPIIHGIASGLYYLEEKNILHGDLKPENIVIFEEDGMYVAKLIDFGISYSNIHEGMVQDKMTTFSWQSPEEMYYTISGEGHRGFKMLSWTFGLLLLECLSPKNITDVTTYSDTFELTGVPSINEKYVRELAPDWANLPREAHIQDEKMDNLVEECLLWDPKKRISMYGICKRLGLEVDLPLSSSRKLDKNVQKVTFPWYYGLFLSRMRRFFKNLDNAKDKYHAPLALSIFLRYGKEDSEVLLCACLSLASKIYGSYFSEFLYEQDEEQGDEIGKEEIRILKVLNGVVVRTTSIDYFNLEEELISSDQSSSDKLEAHKEEDRMENINAWIDIILSGKNYEDLFVLSS